MPPPESRRGSAMTSERSSLVSALELEHVPGSQAIGKRRYLVAYCFRQLLGRNMVEYICASRIVQLFNKTRAKSSLLFPPSAYNHRSFTISENIRIGPPNDGDNLYPISGYNRRRSTVLSYA